MGRRRPLVALLATVALAAGLAATVPPIAASASESDIAAVSDGWLQVNISTKFPQIMGYVDRESGTQLGASTTNAEQLTINGTTHQATVKARTNKGHHAVNYSLSFADLPTVQMDMSITVDANTVKLAITKITDPDKQVISIQLPNTPLVSASSADDTPQVATAVLSVDRAKSGDTITAISPQTPPDASPVGSAYAIVAGNGLAASLETNAETQGGTSNESNRFWRQAVKDGDTVRVGLGSGSWLYRADGSSTTEALGWTKIAVTRDANDDGITNWQDGAIAMRSIMTVPKGADDVPNRVIAHIPFNFASQATHPFLRTLDDVKRISLATDGLGQFVLLKGYAGEGHDSAHPDYADNYNKGAGGLTDLNTLLCDGADWNATFGAHINATEAYPEAKSFSDDLVAGGGQGWDWLGQSYYINQAWDLNSGSFESRIAKLRQETDPNLSTLYVDVYYNNGWRAEKLIDVLARNGFDVATEWADKFEHASLWSHWASDEGYGGTTNKGINSQIIRFIRNSEKDVWNPDSLLGSAQIAEFEGWTGHTDWNAFYSQIWKQNLPAKYLQQHQIMSWAPSQIDLTDGVSVSGTSAADRTVTLNGAPVLSGGSYLLPWYDSATKKTNPRLYHFNQTGGATTWTVPAAFTKTDHLQVYALSYDGRANVGQVPIVNGTVTLNAKAGVPYVLYSSGKKVATQVADWGQGGSVSDPGFNDPSMASWQRTGAVSRVIWGNGFPVAQLGAGNSSISQQLSKLKAGAYQASVWAQIQPGQTRDVTLSIGGTKVSTARNSISATTAENLVAADEKHSYTDSAGAYRKSYFQRMWANFTISNGTARPTLTISAGDGQTAVLLDDVRIAQVLPATQKAVVAENFENTVQGWGPFVKGDAGGVTDPRTVISVRHAPYTQKGWKDAITDQVISGERSLKSHGENGGLVYRTWQGTVPMTPGHKYRVAFDYQSGGAGQYEWITGYDKLTADGVRSVESGVTAIGKQTTTSRFSQDVTAGCGDTWVGLRRIGGDDVDFVLDDFTVADLGTSTDAPACATLAVTGPDNPLKQANDNVVTTTLTLDESASVSDVAVTLSQPDGWQVSASTAASAATLAADATFSTTWNVVPAIDSDGSYPITATVTYQTTSSSAQRKTVQSTVELITYPKPPSGTVYASDMVFLDQSNGWGPIERDQSNGETAAEDGGPLTINGTTYVKGLGTNAPASVTFFLGGRCSSFTSDVGIDDDQASAGTVQFLVKGADGQTLASSPVMTARNGAHMIKTDVSGAQFITLVSDPTPDGNGNDHGDWGGAVFSCDSK